MSSWSVTTSLAPKPGFVANGRNSYMAGGTLVRPNAGTVYDPVRGWIQPPQQNTQTQNTQTVSQPTSTTSPVGTATAPNTQNDFSKYIGQADPFSKYRDQYATKLNSLLADPSSIQNDPAYQFNLKQGQQAVERSQAAKGMGNSGNALTELMQYGQGMASNQFGNMANLYAGLAGANQSPAAGFSAATGGVNAGTNAFSALNDANYKNSILGIAQQNAGDDQFQNNLRNQMLQYSFNQQKNNQSSSVDPYAGWLFG